jgi:hypothetical protein
MRAKECDETDGFGKFSKLFVAEMLKNAIVLTPSAALEPNKLAVARRAAAPGEPVNRSAWLPVEGANGQL